MHIGAIEIEGYKDRIAALESLVKQLEQSLDAEIVKVDALEEETTKIEARYQAAVKQLLLLEKVAAVQRKALEHVRFYVLDNVPEELREIAKQAMGVGNE